MNGSQIVAEQSSVSAHAHSWDAYIHPAPRAIARLKADGLLPAAIGAPAGVARAPQRFPDANPLRRCLV